MQKELQGGPTAEQGASHRCQLHTRHCYDAAGIVCLWCALQHYNGKLWQVFALIYSFSDYDVAHTALCAGNLMSCSHLLQQQRGSPTDCCVRDTFRRVICQ